ncbi:hypothetical protein F4561_006053 [Lipingzhangella halophila]|uniref:Uncharacterized protein n=1 Tax=Lipingzhangella halophila TaxID=1783352 RepID=A0A7W7W6Q0_9ACTN|nr:hypothetical protein [Lipingzhangella halophila]MBB4935159.1 hypothetical protein [Lipingzhangella halophila]
MTTAFDQSHKSAHEPEVVERGNSGAQQGEQRPTVSPKLKELVGEKAWTSAREARHPAAPSN